MFCSYVVVQLRARLQLVVADGTEEGVGVLELVFFILLMCQQQPEIYFFIQNG